MKIDWKKLVISIIITFVIGNLFALFTMNNMDAFKELDKPINIPGIIFPIVWTVLYLLMAISYYIIDKSDNTLKDKAKVIYWVQLAVNSLWTLIFFALKAYLFAFIWLLLLFILVLYMQYQFYKINRKAFYINIPYVIWIIFAGYLNLGIYLLNR